MWSGCWTRCGTGRGVQGAWGGYLHRAEAGRPSVPLSLSPSPPHTHPHPHPHSHPRTHTQVRPYLMADGGNVEFVEIDGPVVFLRLAGACGSCPSSLTTMTMGIKRRLMEKIPVRGARSFWGCGGCRGGPRRRRSGAGRRTPAATSTPPPWLTPSARSLPSPLTLPRTAARRRSSTWSRSPRSRRASS